MAQSMPVTVGRLKDQRVDVLERLQLAKELWQTTGAVGPNKHQVVIDTLITILINDKKRHDLEEEVHCEVWRTLSSLLQSPVLSGLSGQQPDITFRPHTAQMIVETVERQVQQQTDSCHSMLQCCLSILQRPSLAGVLTTRLDILVSLVSAVCHLALTTPAGQPTSTVLGNVMVHLVSHLWQHHHRSQLSPSQVLQMVTDKLLEAVMKVTYHAHHKGGDSQLTSVTDRLLDFVLATLFHESHHRHYKTYLEGVAKQQENTQVPWTVNSIFKKLSSGLQNSEMEGQTGQPSTLYRQVVLHFLPSFYRHAVTTWRQKAQPNQMSFHLFVHLVIYLGVPAEEEGQPCSGVAMETDSVGTLHQLLCVMGRQGVYNVAADRTADGSQLRFLRHLLNSLLVTPVCEEVCRCLLELLSLNHLVLEPRLPAILTLCCTDVTQMVSKCRETLDVFLAELVATYSQLHQVPRFYDFLLKLMAQSPRQLLHIVSLPGFSQQVCAVVTTLTHTTSIQIWGKLQEEIVSASRSVLHHQPSEEDVDRLWVTCLLFHQYLSHVRASDWSAVTFLADKVVTLTSKLENDVVSPLLQYVQGKEDKGKVCGCMLVTAVCLGHVKLTLSSYGSSYMKGPSATSQDLPFSAQLPFLGKKKHRLAALPVVKYLKDVVTVQKLQLLCGEGGDADWPKLLGCLVVGGEEGDTQTAWDGSVSSITEDRYPVARCHLLVNHSWKLQHHADHLSVFVVHALTQTPAPAADSGGSHTCRSVAKHLLQQAAALQASGRWHQRFLHSVVCAAWARFSETATPGAVPSPVLDTLQQLAQTHLAWDQVEDSEVKAVTASIQDVLTSGDIQSFSLNETQAAVLQVLQELPLHYLLPTTKLQCTLGLLVILAHQDRQSWPSSDRRVANTPAKGQVEGHVREQGGRGRRSQDADDVKDLICEVGTVLLEGSVRTSLFHCVSPQAVLGCLHTMLLQSEGSEQSSLATLLKKAVAMVTGDFHCVLNLGSFITDVEKGLKKMCKFLSKKAVSLTQAEHRSLLILTHCVLSGIQRLLKKDFFRKDVQAASRQHFERLSTAVETAVDCYRQQGCQYSLSPELLRCFTAVSFQHCKDSEQGVTTMTEEHLERTQFVLGSLNLMDPDGQEGGWLMEELSLVSCLYQHHTSLPSTLTSDLTHTLWASLLHLLQRYHGNHETDEEKNQESDVAGQKSPTALGKRERRKSGEISSIPSKKQKRKDGGASVSTEEEKKEENLCQQGGREGKKEGAGGVVEREEEEEKVLDTMTVVLASCSTCIFSQLLQCIVSTTTDEVKRSMRVWQRVVSSDKLTVEQRKLLESFCITVLQQCVGTMQQVHSYPPGHCLQVGLPILRCITAMLSQHQLLSTKGTALCLLCVSLVPLSHGGYDHFLSLLPAVCDAVHAVLVHHPHSASTLLDQCLAVSAAVMRECVRRGDQKALLASPDFIQPMAACAERVNRLLTLLVSEGREVQRVVATLVSDYTTTAQSLTLLPQVKKSLLSGMYACLDACDKHAVNQLRQRLPPGVREVFHMLHSDYISYHKYTGKV